MKRIMAIVVVLSQIAVIVEPAVGRRAAAIAGEAPADIKKLDHQLQSQSQARVLISPDWHLLGSLRAMDDGLHANPLSSPDSTIAPHAVIPWARVDEIQVRTSGAGWGAIVGGVIGAGLGAAAAVATSSETSPFDDPNAPNKDTKHAWGGAAGGFAVGALLGAAIGSAFKHWKRAYPR
jgi:hypothetical protein